MIVKANKPAKQWIFGPVIRFMRNQCWEINWEYKRRSKIDFFKNGNLSHKFIDWKPQLARRKHLLQPNVKWSEVLLFILNLYFLSSMEMFCRMLKAVFHTHKKRHCDQKKDKKAEKGQKTSRRPYFKSYDIFIQETDQNL